MRIALDTNVLAYAEGVNGAALRETALAVVYGLPPEVICLPVQTLGELFNLLVRKAARDRKAAQLAIMNWRDAFPLIETSAASLIDAAGLAADHKLGIWDAVILAAAARAGCRLLLSEDLQDGFTWSGVTVANPFAPSPHPLLSALLAQPGRP
ncbi:MAG: PIN domain-containing protein [Stellaceae bacterium]